MIALYPLFAGCCLVIGSFVSGGGGGGKPIGISETRERRGGKTRGRGGGRLGEGGWGEKVKEGHIKYGHREKKQGAGLGVGGQW